MQLDHNDDDIAELMKDRSLSRIWWELNCTGRKGVKESRLLKIFVVVISVANFVFLLFADPDSLPSQIYQRTGI